MKKILSVLFFLVLLYACNNVVNPPADNNRIDNILLARTAALAIANYSFYGTYSIQSDQTLNDYIVDGHAGSVTLNGTVEHSSIMIGDEVITDHILINMDMDFSGYNYYYSDLTIADGSLFVNSSYISSILKHDIAGTIDVFGTINGETIDDTIILDFEWDDGIFTTGGTLTNGEGIVFNL